MTETYAAFIKYVPTVISGLTGFP